MIEPLSRVLRPNTIKGLQALQDLGGAASVTEIAVRAGIKPAHSVREAFLADHGAAAARGFQLLDDGQGGWRLRIDAR